MRLLIVFRSGFMEEDKLRLSGENLEEIKQQFLNWWKGYGKEEDEAMATILWTEEMEDEQ